MISDDDDDDACIVALMIITIAFITIQAPRSVWAKWTRVFVLNKDISHNSQKRGGNFPLAPLMQLRGS